jgi:hypothetical protein
VQLLDQRQGEVHPFGGATSPECTMPPCAERRYVQICQMEQCSIRPTAQPGTVNERGDMSVDYSLPSSRTEMLAVVVRRLEAEFPTMPRDQVVRCVQVAREAARADASSISLTDPSKFAAAVESQARGYLTDIQAVRKRSASQAATGVVDLNGADRRRLGRHRRTTSGSNAVA